MKPTSPVDTSAQALLRLIQSVHEASRASADRRGRSMLEDPTTSDDDAARTPKKRKPTTTARKEEMAELSEEICRLNARIAYLQGRTASVEPGAKSGQETSSPEVNAALREVIHEHELSMASARSVISWFTANEYSMPVHCYVHLPETVDDRYRALQAVKPRQLRLGRRYMLERSRHLNLNVAHAANEKFTKDNGDVCFMQFTLNQFPTTFSVREVFEAASYFTACLEISLTDGAGQITIREEDTEFDDPTIVHNRFLVTVGDDLHVEGNIVLFTYFDEEDDYGLVAGTFVDHDDKYPYRPNERLRQDATAILMISREREHVVVRRFGYNLIHHNDKLAVDPGVIQELSESVTRWGNAIHAQMRARFSA